MRRRPVLLSVVALLLLLGVAQPATAHDYFESGNIRVAGCALSGKYGCQSHYLSVVNDPVYGPLYQARHSHACTDQGGDASWWGMPSLRIQAPSGTDVWSEWGHSSHQHNTEWCGQSVTVHQWFPNAYVPRGTGTTNRFAVNTLQQFPSVQMDCRHQIEGLTLTTSGDPLGSNISPAGSNC